MVREGLIWYILLFLTRVQDANDIIWLLIPPCLSKNVVLHNKMASMSLTVRQHPGIRQESFALTITAKLKCIKEAYDVTKDETELRKNITDLQRLLGNS